MKIKNILSTFVVGAVLFLFIGQYVQAFSISPPTLDIELNPEETYEGNLILYDENLKGTTVKLEIKNFIVDPENGKFDRLIDPTNGEESWVKLSQDTIELPATGEAVEVPFSITPSIDAESGTHQISISYLELLNEEGDKNKKADTKIIIKPTLVTNIFLRIAGLVIEDADLELFAITKDLEELKTEEEKKQGYKIKDFFESTPVYFLIRFNNKGNVHLRPDGNIKIKDRIGNIKFKEKANEDLSIVPAGSKHEYIVGPFEDKLAVGQFFAKGTMLYGNDTKEASQSVEFFVFPWKIALLVLVIILLIILLVIIIVCYRRKKKLKEQKEYQEKYKKDVAEKVKDIVEDRDKNKII